MNSTDASNDLKIEYAILYEGKKYGGYIILEKETQTWEKLEGVIGFMGAAIRLGVRKNKIILSPHEDDEEILAHFKPDV